MGQEKSRKEAAKQARGRCWRSNPDRKGSGPVLPGGLTQESSNTIPSGPMWRGLSDPTRRKKDVSPRRQMVPRIRASPEGAWDQRALAWKHRRSQKHPPPPSKNSPEAKLIHNNAALGHRPVIWGGRSPQSYAQALSHRPSPHGCKHPKRPWGGWRPGSTTICFVFSRSRPVLYEHKVSLMRLPLQDFRH